MSRGLWWELRQIQHGEVSRGWDERTQGRGAGHQASWEEVCSRRGPLHSTDSSLALRASPTSNIWVFRASPTSH